MAGVMLIYRFYNLQNKIFLKKEIAFLLCD